MKDGLKLQLLIRQKMSQREFCRLSGYGEGYLSRIINSDHVPMPLKEKVSEILGYPVEKWAEKENPEGELLGGIPLGEKLISAIERKKEAKELAMRFENERLKAQVALLEAHLAQILKMRGEEW